MEDYKKLELSWRIADFLPVSEKLGTITEYIIPEMDADMDGNTSYWNVPEILLGIRWIHEVADNSDISSGGYGEKSRAEYDRTMQKFRILTRLLQSYALRHYIYDQKLQNLRKEKAAFIDFWDEYKQVIRKASKHTPLSDAEKEKLVEAASRLLEMADSENNQAAAFRRNLETNNSGIRDSFRKIQESAEKLRQEYPEGFDLLTDIQHRKAMLGIQLLQVTGMLEGNAVFSLRASIQNKDFHIIRRTSPPHSAASYGWGGYRGSGLHKRRIRCRQRPSRQYLYSGQLPNPAGHSGCNNGKLFIKHFSDRLALLSAIRADFGVMQEVNNLIVLIQIVDKMNKVPEVLCDVCKFVVSLFFAPIEELIDQQVLRIINNDTLRFAFADDHLDP